MRGLTHFVLSFTLLAPAFAFAEQAVLYKDPNCGCCEGHADHLRTNGIDPAIVPTDELSALRQEQGVPDELVGCHMLLIDGYVVEGHVSAASIKRLLTERPAIKGISLPGMPMGSPGMSGPKTEPLVVYSFGDTTTTKVFSVE